MKLILLTLLVPLAVFLGACDKKINLEGASFSDIEVRGSNTEIARDLIMYEISEANGRVGIPNSPKLSVVSYVGVCRNDGETVQVLLEAQTSSGTHAEGFSDEGRTTSSKLAIAAHYLVAELSRQTKKKG